MTTPTPTAPDRVVRHADFPTLTQALDFAATGQTGITLYGGRGECLRTVTYAELRTEALALARRLIASGLAPGDRVGLAAETDADFIRAFFACQYAGLMPAPLPLPAPLGGRAAYVEQIARMLGAAQASAVFGPAPYAEWLREAADQAGGIAIGPSLNELPEAVDVTLPDIGPDDLAYVQFSSGSTRFPTGVMVTHRSLMANAVAITRDGLQVVAQDRAVSWLPLYHDMGLIGFLLAPLCCQMTVDLLPTSAFVRRPLLWLDLISRNGGTVSYSPTFGYELCARRAETGSSATFELSRWRIAGVGGDMVRVRPLTEFAERFGGSGFDARAYVASYGMAEATLAVAMAPLGRGLQVETLNLLDLEGDGDVIGGAVDERSRGFVRCGPALPGHRIEVRDADGRSVPDGHVGRIFIQGASLMRGYFGNPDATADVLSGDGWLETGDLGLIVDGEIVPTGRAKDLILINGRNLWPQDLEWSVEAELDRVRSGDVAAFHISDGDAERVVVLVQSRSGDAEARETLTSEVAALLRARHGVEAAVHLVGPHDLPKTTSGKLSRTRARVLFLAGTFDGLQA
ncbi:MAG: fatty acyl-AMP ligase [Brevundimonas mediterranea]